MGRSASSRMDSSGSAAVSVCVSRYGSSRPPEVMDTAFTPSSCVSVSVTQ